MTTAGYRDCIKRQWRWIRAHAPTAWQRWAIGSIRWRDRGAASLSIAHPRLLGSGKASAPSPASRSPPGGAPAAPSPSQSHHRQSLTLRVDGGRPAARYGDASHCRGPGGPWGRGPGPAGAAARGGEPGGMRSRAAMRACRVGVRRRWLAATGMTSAGSGRACSSLPSALCSGC